MKRKKKSETTHPNISPLGNCFVNDIVDSSTNIAVRTKLANNQRKEVAIISIVICSTFGCLYIKCKAFGVDLHDWVVALSLVWLSSIPQMCPPPPSNRRRFVDPGLQWRVRLFVQVSFQKYLWQIRHFRGTSGACTSREAEQLTKSLFGGLALA